MTKLLQRKILKFLTYAIIVFTAYILQTTPALLEFFGVKPLLVLSLCICIAVFEGEFAGGLFGFFIGLFCDSTSEIVFGFYAVIYLVLCVSAGLLTIYVFRKSTMNIMLLCLGAIFLTFGFEFFFAFVLYDYEGIIPYFYTVIAPQIVYSSIFAFPFCVLMRYLHRRFEPDEMHE